MSLGDLASSCRMWVVNAHTVAPFLSRHRHRRESLPSQAARSVSGTPGKASPFDRYYARRYGSAVAVLLSGAKG
jgi:hypothetical protein